MLTHARAHILLPIPFSSTQVPLPPELSSVLRPGEAGLVSDPGAGYNESGGIPNENTGLLTPTASDAFLWPPKADKPSHSPPGESQGSSATYNPTRLGQCLQKQNCSAAGHASFQLSHLVQ